MVPYDMQRHGSGGSLTSELFQSKYNRGLNNNEMWLVNDGYKPFIQSFRSVSALILEIGYLIRCHRGPRVFILS